MSQAIHAHRKATHASVQEMASTLVDTLGRVLTAYIVHVRTPKTVTRWAKGEVTQVRDRYSEERLLAAYQVVSLLLEYEHPSSVRQFMMGMSPEINDRAPAQALRDGDFSGAMAAAKGLVSGSY